MLTSQTTTSLFKALIEAAPDISSIGKSKQAYGYKYATLDNLIDMLRMVLPKHGIWFVQTPARQGGVSTLTTRVFHDSGEWIEDTIEMTDTELQGKANDTQRVGASITYYRRYALSAIFGVAADEDVDGNINNIRQPARPQPKPEQKKQDPLVYLKSDIKARTDNGEEYNAVLKDYADILKTDAIKPIESLNEKELTIVATEIFKRRRANV